MIFIAAILVLDMLVIDRKAHVVSIKEAGSWTAVWIILALAFAVFIYFHGDMVHGIENFGTEKMAQQLKELGIKLDVYVSPSCATIFGSPVVPEVTYQTSTERSHHLSAYRRVAC